MPLTPKVLFHGFDNLGGVRANIVFAGIGDRGTVDVHFVNSDFHRSDLLFFTGFVAVPGPFVGVDLCGWIWGVLPRLPNRTLSPKRATFGIIGIGEAI